MSKKGRLFVVGTPIGNLQDITLRALETLKEVDSIFAEDTRRTKKLLTFFNFSKPLFSYHDHSPEQKADFVIKKIKRGESIALVSDAGMPAISDPGYVIIKKAIEENIKITIIPGPSAILMALLVSGLPPAPFAFLGFPPPAASKRKKFFQKYSTTEMTLVVFEAPHRLKKTLSDIKNYWGNRFMAITRELTKIHEEVVRGKVEELIANLPDNIKGEITLVIEGSKKEKNLPDEKRWLEELKNLLQLEEKKTSEVAKFIAKKYSLPRSMVYSKAMEIKNSLSVEESNNNP